MALEVLVVDDEADIRELVSGVLEDEGWHTHQFHAGTEFYADFGVYDVRMTRHRTSRVALDI